MEIKMPYQPLISVITVCFNSGELIRRTIESVLGQTYANIEYILVDGKSTDNTLNIIKEYEEVFAKKGIAYKWITEPDTGLYDAMNKGIKLATGKWLNFMNSGDLFFNNDVLEGISVKLTGDLVYGNHAVYFGTMENYKLIDVSNRNDKRNIPFCHQALFLRKGMGDKFPFDLQYKVASDYDQYLNCKHSGAVITHVPLNVAWYFDGGVSSLLSSRKQVISEYFIIAKKHGMHFASAIYAFRIVKLLFMRSLKQFAKTKWG